MTCSRRYLYTTNDGTNMGAVINDQTGQQVSAVMPMSVLSEAHVLAAMQAGRCNSPPPPPPLPPPVASQVPPPSPPPPAGCPEGTTRQVKCPKDASKTVTQRCVNGSWVTLPADEKTCEGTDPAKVIIAAFILALVLVFLGSRS